jgi:glycerol-3-phosphate acyltransferase PlsY
MDDLLMFDALVDIALFVVLYLIGNISPAIILGRVYGVDVRKEGSGNAGTTNVLRTVGKKAGVITLVIDILKGFIPVFIVNMWLNSTGFSVLCGIFIVVGHMWPMIFKFRGGKGVATTFGVLLAAQPILALILLGIVAVGILVTRRMSVGVIIAVILAVPISYFIDSEIIIWISIVALLILIKHRANIKRIISGTEPKISFGSKDTNK